MASNVTSMSTMTYHNLFRFDLIGHNSSMASISIFMTNMINSYYITIMTIKVSNNSTS